MGESLWTPHNTVDWAPPHYEGDRYTDPISRVVIEKDPEKNLEQRANILARCEKDEAFREAFVKRLSLSPLLAINLLFWTELVFDVRADGTSYEVDGVSKNRPFVTWPAQDREILRIARAWRQGKNIRGVKAREVGWSWIYCGFAAWCVLFRQRVDVMFISRKEEEVDAIGKPDSLFAKVRYNLDRSRMPEWLHPTLKGIEACSKHMLIRNPETQSTVTGEATVEGAGRSGRKSWVLIDEGAEVRHLRKMYQSLSSTTKSCFIISTGKPGSDFNKLFDDPGFETARILWFEDRRKAKGLEKCDVDDEHPHGFTSPWYEHELANSTPERMAQEVNAQLVGAGEYVFNQTMLKRHLEAHGEAPAYEGELWWVDRMKPNDIHVGDAILKCNSPTTPFGDIAFAEGSGKKELKVFTPLETCAQTGVVRPPQNALYVIGADVGGGQMRSNSAIVVLDASDKSAKLAAYWASSQWEPHDLARHIVALANWFGGFRAPLVGWETNGPGGALKKYMVEVFKYPDLYRKKTHGKIREKQTDVVGWNTTPHLKQAMLEHVADGLASRRLIIPSKYVLDELREFIYSDAGDIVQSKRADLNTRAREGHADTGMALAGAFMLLNELPRFNREVADRVMASRDESTWYGSRVARMKAQAKAKKSGGWTWHAGV